MALFDETLQMLAQKNNTVEVIRGEDGVRTVSSVQGKAEMRFEEGTVSFFAAVDGPYTGTEQEIAGLVNELNATRPFFNLCYAGGQLWQSYLIPDESMADAAALCELFEYHETVPIIVQARMQFALEQAGGHYAE